MEPANLNGTSYSIITGFSDISGLQFSVSILVLFIYLVTIGGNMTILLLVYQDQQLHTPMYFFLCNLSIIDICCSTNNLPNIFISFILGDNINSVPVGLIQIFIFISLTCAESLILAAMSYDRYVAICKPLCYNLIMNSQVCTLLAISCWVLGAIESVPILIGLFKFTCYSANTINHFKCDIFPAMTSSDTSFLGLYILGMSIFISTFCPFLLTVISYVYIIVSVLKISSTFRRQKAFYTCSSELVVFILLHTNLALQYYRPLSSISLDSNKLISLFIMAAVPMLNPLIYCLKNEDVKVAFRRSIRLTALKCSKN